MKVTIRKAKPKSLPKLAKGEIMDPTLELERDCSHVCEVAVEGQETLKFMGNSPKEAFRQALDHMGFSATAYAALLFPEPAATLAKAVQIQREMDQAGFVAKVIKKKSTPKPKPKPNAKAKTQNKKSGKKVKGHA